MNVITSQSGAIEQELSFDAWGNRRNPDTWVNLTGTPANLITRRGFTGHEHIDEFGLINMNSLSRCIGSRMYDPVLGRFLSPDPIVANSNNTQDYNRYSYVLNNPLMMTDPSGYQYYPKNNAEYIVYCDGFSNSTWGAMIGDGSTYSHSSGGGGGSGYQSFTPHIDAHKGDFAGMAGYVWDSKSGKYIDKATGQYVDSQTAISWMYDKAVSKGEKVDSYKVYETQYKNARGEWVGNGNFGVIQINFLIPKLATSIAVEVPLKGGIGVTIGVSVSALASMSLAFPLILAGDTRVAEDDIEPYSYVTYTKFNPSTGQVYIGRTEGYGTPFEVLAKRERTHHMNRLGYEPAILDRYLVSTGALISDRRWAIRGREQMMIDFFGGIGNPLVGNKINGISSLNPFRPLYMSTAYMYFGPVIF